MAQVILKRVKKVFEGGIVAVHAFDLEVHDREFVVLVGPSGCGKSTTLRMIAGLEDLTEGEIFIDGRLVNDVPPKDRDIAMVFQNYALYPHMTVYENMGFGLKLRQLPKKEIAQRVLEAASILGIEDCLNRKPKALSGGQRQRVVVGRAIVRKPKVFLFDEPLSNLDAKLRVQMRTEISKLHQKLGATMIYVTHDQTEAMTMADKIVLMKDGIVQQVNSPPDIYNHPLNKFVAGFIGSPSMNFFRGKIQKGRQLQFKEFGGSLSRSISAKHQTRLRKYINNEIVHGLRPEHIYESEAKDGSGGRVKVNVSVVEPMGNEFYLYFQTGIEEDQHVARFTSDQHPQVGKPLELRFDTEKAHYFDPVTEKVV
jgi:multiple sugar transport system ATP-binding protein